MRQFTPSSELAPEQRRCELTEILAAGILRLRKQRLLTGAPGQMRCQTSPESPASRLEVSDTTVLSVHTG